MPRVPRNTPGLHSPGGPAATRQAGGQPQGTSPLGSPDPVQEVGAPVPHWDTELRCQGGASKTHLPQEDDRHRRPQESIMLPEAFRLDLAWWQALATPWNGRSFFLLPHWTPFPDLELFIDSFGTTGFVAYCQVGLR